MKNALGKYARIGASVFSALLLLSACQQSPLDPTLSQFQNRAGANIAALHNTMVKAFKGVRGIRGASEGRGVMRNSNPFGNNYAEQVGVSDCLEVYKSIPETAANYAGAMTFLAGCLSQIDAQQPLATNSFGVLDQRSQFNYLGFMAGNPGLNQCSQGFGSWFNLADGGGGPGSFNTQCN